MQIGGMNLVRTTPDILGNDFHWSGGKVKVADPLCRVCRGSGLDGRFPLGGCLCVEWVPAPEDLQLRLIIEQCKEN